MKEVKIVNIKQAIVYSQNGLQPIRLEYGYGNKCVFVFDKEKSYEIYIRWLNHEFIETIY